MKTMQKIKKAVTKVMLGGALLSVGMGGCEVIDITPATGEQRASQPSTVPTADGDTRSIFVIILNHNETFLADEAE